MPIFSRKNVHSHENTFLSYNLFLIFLEKPLLASPYFVMKNVDYVKTTLYYGRKKLMGCLVFRFFTKNLLLQYPWFVKKTSVL